jgi:circadian clock protein KaiB
MTARRSDRPKAAREASSWRSHSVLPSSPSDKVKRQLEQALHNQGTHHYVLRLYVTGATPASSRAIQQVRSICDEHLSDRYELEVIDIYQKPALAKDEQIIATPTLIKVLPAPLRRFVGDLSKVEKILFGLDLREKS